MSFLDIKATRESELLVNATENPTEVIHPHIHTHVTYQPTHTRSTMIYDVQVQCYRTLTHTGYGANISITLYISSRKAEERSLRNRSDRRPPHVPSLLDNTNNLSIRPGLDLRWPSTCCTESTQELVYKPGILNSPTPKVSINNCMHTEFHR